MITTKHGSIFDSTAQVLVCPVNCVGVMGKGLALEFKRRFPKECGQFLADHRRGWSIDPGQVILYCRRIAMAATKNDWRRPSRLEWVDACLIGIASMDTASIAIPQLGCGCGGLDWADVEPLYHKHLGDLPVDVEVWIYE